MIPNYDSMWIRCSEHWPHPAWNLYLTKIDDGYGFVKMESAL